MLPESDLKIFPLGTGINTLEPDQELTRMKVSKIEKKTDNAGLNTASGTYICHSHIFESHEFRSKQIELGLNLDVIVQPVEGQLSLNYQRQDLYDETTVCGFFSCSYYAFSEELQAITLNDSMMKKITGTDKDKSDFFDSYGDACVTKIDYGKRVYAILRIKCSNKEEASKLGAELKLQLTNVGAVASDVANANGRLHFNFDQTSLAKARDVNIEILAVGASAAQKSISFTNFSDMFQAMTEIMEAGSATHPIAYHYQPYHLLHYVQSKWPYSDVAAEKFIEHCKNVSRSRELLKAIAGIVEKLNMTRIAILEDMNWNQEKYIRSDEFLPTMTALEELQNNLTSYIKAIKETAPLCTNAKFLEWKSRIDELKAEAIGFSKMSKWVDNAELRLISIRVPANQKKSQAFSFPVTLSDNQFIRFHVSKSHPNPESVTFSLRKVRKIYNEDTGYGSMKTGTELSVKDLKIERGPNKNSSQFMIKDLPRSKVDYDLIVGVYNHSRNLRNSVYLRQSPSTLFSPSRRTTAELSEESAATASPERDRAIPLPPDARPNARHKNERASPIANEEMDDLRSPKHVKSKASAL